jgi:hypothetical protein
MQQKSIASACRGATAGSFFVTNAPIHTACKAAKGIGSRNSTRHTALFMLVHAEYFSLKAHLSNLETNH